MKETVEEGHGIFSTKDHNVLAQTLHPESCKLAPGRDTGPEPIASRGQGQKQDPGPGSPHTLQPEFPELDGISETRDPGGSQWEKTRKALTGINFLLWHHQWKTGSSRRCAPSGAALWLATNTIVLALALELLTLGCGKRAGCLRHGVRGAGGSPEFWAEGRELGGDMRSCRAPKLGLIPD